MSDEIKKRKPNTHKGLCKNAVAWRNIIARKDYQETRNFIREWALKSN